jgi:tRNA pseudouridine-54 N-methylase
MVAYVAGDYSAITAAGVKQLIAKLLQIKVSIGPLQEHSPVRIHHATSPSERT